MNEEFLYYVWEKRLYNPLDLKTISGESLEVVSPGIRNHCSGPDFSEAAIKLNGIMFYGSVEIHVNSSDWYLHGHQFDQTYNKIILHVVYRHDREIKNYDLQIPPTLALYSYFSENYIYLKDSRKKYRAEIPCAKSAVALNESESWLESLFAMRFQSKIQQIKFELHAEKENYTEVFYRFLVRAFGVPANSDVFLMSARQLPFKTLSLYLNDPYLLKVLFFGIWGFKGLKKDKTNYLQMKTDFEFLSIKHNLKIVTNDAMKLGANMPNANPENKIIQLCAMLPYFFQFLSMVFSKAELNKIFDQFYNFFNRYPYLKIKVGFQNMLWFNLMMPFIYILKNQVYGPQKISDQYLQLIKRLPAEDNRIIRMFSSYGVLPKNYLHSQALLHQYKELCAQKRCSRCQISQNVLGKIESVN